MSYSAIAVANSIIEKAKEKGIKDLSPMKLMKLVYFAHAWSLALRNEPLIDEPVEAWKYGPVIRSVYSEFKQYGKNNVSCFAYDVGIDDELYAPSINRNDIKVNLIIKEVVNKYGHLSAAKLSLLTHKPESAWGATSSEHDAGHVRHYIISNDQIRKAAQQTLGISKNE